MCHSPFVECNYWDIRKPLPKGNNKGVRKLDGMVALLFPSRLMGQPKATNMEKGAFKVLMPSGWGIPPSV